MIISMKPDATQEQIEHVCERIREFGYKVHSIQGEERVVICPKNIRIWREITHSSNTP